jgi:hypothetical protein
MEAVQKYYKECRNGEILTNEYGFVAVNRFRESTQVIEHLYVTSEDFEKGFGQLIKHAHDSAVENNCRYLKYSILLGEPNIYKTHRRLVDLGFYPVQSPANVVEYERRVR